MYDASRLAKPLKMSKGATANFPVHSLANADIITINVEEKDELAPTKGTISVVAHPLSNSFPANMASVN